MPTNKFLIQQRMSYLLFLSERYDLQDSQRTSNSEMGERSAVNFMPQPHGCPRKKDREKLTHPHNDATRSRQSKSETSMKDEVSKAAFPLNAATALGRRQCR